MSGNFNYSETPVPDSALEGVMVSCWACGEESNMGTFTDWPDIDEFTVCPKCGEVSVVSAADHVLRQPTHEELQETHDVAFYLMRAKTFTRLALQNGGLQTMMTIVADQHDAG